MVVYKNSTLLPPPLVLLVRLASLALREAYLRANCAYQAHSTPSWVNQLAVYVALANSVLFMAHHLLLLVLHVRMEITAHQQALLRAKAAMDTSPVKAALHALYLVRSLHLLLVK